jgi:hypothetical protein
MHSIPTKNFLTLLRLITFKVAEMWNPGCNNNFNARAMVLKKTNFMENGFDR